MSRPSFHHRVAALGLAALLALCSTGCASNGVSGPPDLTGPTAIDPTELADSDQVDQVGQVTSLDCGVSIDVLQSSGSALTMTGQFPAGADRSGDGAFAGSVTVTGLGVTGVASPEADVYLVQAGAVVSTPGPKDSVGQ